MSTIAGTGFYLRLEVAPTASRVEVTRAYRRLAHDVHPDAHPDDPDAGRRFREITEAYEVLGGPARRARYDANQASGRGVVGVPPSTGNLAEARGPRASAPDLVPRQFQGTPGPGSPVYIGTWARSASSAFLWAGPARVEAPLPGVASALGRGDVASEAARAFCALLSSWGWY